jgi:hypothetical protein
MLAVGIACLVSIASPAQGQPSPQFPKRGWGGSASRYPSDAMNPNWYYTWGRTAIPAASSEFVPMAWSKSSVTSEASFQQLLGHRSDYILGFNEPERAEQANMTVAEAIALWPKLMTTGKKLVSPAVGTDSLGMTWLTSFLSEVNRLNLRVDAVAIHWYGDVRPTNAHTGFLNRIDAIYNTFTNNAGQKYPLWITEFGGIDWTEGVNPVTQEMNARFLAGALPGLDSRPHVERPRPATSTTAGPMPRASPTPSPATRDRTRSTCAAAPSRTPAHPGASVPSTRSRAPLGCRGTATGASTTGGCGSARARRWRSTVPAPSRFRGFASTTTETFTASPAR